MSQPGHLVVYSDAPAPGGAEMTLGVLLAALPPAIRLTVVAIDAEVGRWLTGDRPGADLRVVAPIADRRDVAGMLRHRRLFSTLRPDLIQFNLSMMPSCQWAMATALTLRGVPVVAVENSPMATWSSTSLRLKRWTSSRLAGHVAVGEATAREVERAGGLPAGSVATLYHGVPDVPTTAPRDLGPGRWILNVARHDPVKGIDVLFESMARLPEDIGLVQIGSGPESGALVELHRRLGLGDRVLMRTLPWDVRAADTFASYDAFVLPSRLEGLPVTIMEAMLSARPVVATDVGAVREALVDGETGRVVPPEDPDALAGAILDVLDPEVGPAMGTAARKVALGRFTVDATVDAYLDLYRRAMSG